VTNVVELEPAVNDDRRAGGGPPDSAELLRLKAFWLAPPVIGGVVVPAGAVDV